MKYLALFSAKNTETLQMSSAECLPSMQSVKASPSTMEECRQHLR